MYQMIDTLPRKWWLTKRFFRMLFPDGETVLPKTNQEIFSDYKKHFYKLNGAMAHLPVIYILGTKY